MDTATLECPLPADILDDETIVRTIRQRTHLHKTKDELKNYAFRPKKLTDDLSVMRYDHMGIHFCHTKAQEISSGDATNIYAGLALLKTREIRAVGAQVIDSREGQFCGHAHISYGIVEKIDDPLSPQEMEMLDSMIESVRKAAKFFRVPDPAASVWSAPSPEL